MTGSNFDSRAKTLPLFGDPLGTPNLKKSQNTTKKRCPESSAEKNMLLEVARIGPMCDPYSKYHMFREVKECPFGWLWVRVGFLGESR